MSGPITSGIGLLSGLPVQDLIDQLIAVDSRPLTLLQNRRLTIQTQRTSFADINARLLGLKNTVSRLDDVKFFRQSKATSSNEKVLTASVGENAVRGSFTFQVKSLVTNHQLITRGFADAITQAVGAGRISVETSQGRLNRTTPLDRLNGGNGVRRGSIEIIDSQGSRSEIDLSTALTVQDVLDEFNSRTDVRVRARVEGDHFVLQDEAGGSQALVVRDLAGGQAAADLGIAGQTVAGETQFTGTKVVYLSDSTVLSQLNDGNGIGVGKTNKDLEIVVGDRVIVVGLRGLLSQGAAGQSHTGTQFAELNSGAGVRQGTFRITNRAGQSADVVVDDQVKSIGDVIKKINDAGIMVTATVGAARGQLILTDASTPSGTSSSLKVEDVTGHAATDLGIVGTSSGAGLTGGVIYRVDTVSDVIRAINHGYSIDSDGTHRLNDVVSARISDDGMSLSLKTIDGTGEFSVRAAAGGIDSLAANNLGLIGDSSGGEFHAREVLAGMNTVLLSSLRGGQGIRLGGTKLTAADGTETTLNFSGIATVQELIDHINAQTPTSKISARLNPAGTGLEFLDESGGSGVTRLKDLSGRTIGDLFDQPGEGAGIVDDFSGGVRATGNAQLQYVSHSTKLSGLNGGAGVGAGSFRVTARNGQSVTIPINENQSTVGQLLDRMNSLLFSGVSAKINRNGDGIEIVDTTTGSGKLSVTDLDGSTVARSLNLTRNAADRTLTDGSTVHSVDGSFEYTVDVSIDDSLNDVRDKINALSAGVRASVVNDGGANSPFRLVLNSEISGIRGEFVLDAGATRLAPETLVRAQDAVVFFGGKGALAPIVLTSSTNTLDNVLDGVSIELQGTSDEPVEISITQDLDSIVNDLGTFVSSYNAVLDRLRDVTSFDAETNARGPLFGDNTVDVIRNRLRNLLSAPVTGVNEEVSRLSAVGIRAGSGGRLTFDESVFRERLANDPQAIEQFFTTADAGFGPKLDNLLNELTDTFDGLLTRKDGTLEDSEELLRDRIVSLNEVLDRKRTRLEREFQALESALAELQGAQSALTTLAGLSAGFTRR